MELEFRELEQEELLSEWMSELEKIRDGIEARKTHIAHNYIIELNRACSFKTKEQELKF